MGIAAKIRRIAFVAALTLVAGRASASTVLTLVNGLAGPAGVAVDSRGDVFVSDTGSGAIRELVAAYGAVPDNPTILTIVPPGRFANPTALALDAAGNLFVTDLLQQQAFEVTAASGYTGITAIGGGQAFNNPTGIAVDPSGNVFVADGSNNILWELTAASGYGTAVQIAGPWLTPTAVAADRQGNVFVADSINGDNGAVWQALAVGGAVPPGPTVNQLAFGFVFRPLDGITVDPAGNVFVSNPGSPEIDEIPASGGYANGQVATTAVNRPANLGTDRFGNVYIADSGNGAVEEIQFLAPPPIPALGPAALILLALALAGTAYRLARRPRNAPRT